MKFKLFAFDLDGTLTTSDKLITKNTKEAIKRLRDNGIQIVLASGRPDRGMEYVAKELEFDKFGGYILAFNGGKIFEYKTGEVIYEESISRDVALEVAKYAENIKGATVITYQGENIITTSPDDEYVLKEIKCTAMKTKKVEKFSESIDFTIDKFLIVGQEDGIAKQVDIMQKMFGDKLNIFRSEPYFLEVVPQNIDKAKSLQRLINHLNIDVSELVAFGDGLNDISMLDFAGFSIAMENAADIVKEKADYITKKNDEDGVQYAIDKIFEGHI